MKTTTYETAKDYHNRQAKAYEDAGLTRADYEINAHNQDLMYHEDNGFANGCGYIGFVGVGLWAILKLVAKMNLKKNIRNEQNVLERLTLKNQLRMSNETDEPDEEEES